MICPTLEMLPPPPSHKTGWPWTEASPPLAATMPEGRAWPKISVVTPSYNQGEFIEETIRSVLLQNYPNLEYIVIDGGSTDNTVSIIQKYEPWLTYWVSERDRGQGHALNKGFARCTGELIGWINSDDLLVPEAFNCLAQNYCQAPEAILLGEVINFFDYAEYVQLERPRNITFETVVEPWRYDMFWHQPGLYVPRTLQQKVGELDESLRYTFDWDWLCRLLQIASVHYLHTPIARFRHHHASKTVAETIRWLPETEIVTKRYWPKIEGLDYSLAEAGLEFHMASIYLRLHTWNRRNAIKHLLKSLRHNWRVVQLPGFMSLIFKAILPLNLLQLARSLYHYLLKLKYSYYYQ